MSTTITQNITGPVLLDPKALRIPITSRNSEKRRSTNLNITKPKPDAWVAVHPHPAYHWQNFWAYEKDRKLYILDPTIYDALPDNVQRVFFEHDFYLATELNADIFVWPVKHTDTNWFRTLHGAALEGQRNWVQVQSNSRTGQYDCRQPSAVYDVPDWSEFSTEENALNAFNQAFSGRIISDPHHGLLKRIGGRE